MRIAESELILNPDGSVYHLHLLPEEIADTIITVGDPERVSAVSSFFDTIERKRSKREFVTHTGTYKGKQLTVLSTGIGTDNIDIVLNELDALVNINLKTREIKEEKQSLQIVRLGTSGCLDENIPVDSYLLSTFGFGLDGLLGFYQHHPTKQEKELHQLYQNDCADFQANLPLNPTFSQASGDLLQHFSSPDTFQGITATCSGFYGPQGRQLRLQPAFSDFLTQLGALRFGNHRITNFEMETAGIYGLANLLGHRALSVNLLIANRTTQTFSKQPKQSMKQMIEWALEKLTQL